MPPWCGWQPARLEVGWPFRGSPHPGAGRHETSPVRAREFRDRRVRRPGGLACPRRIVVPDSPPWPANRGAFPIMTQSSDSPGTPDRWLVLFLAALTYFTLYLHRYLLNYLQPPIKAAFDLTDEQV